MSDHDRELLRVFLNWQDDHNDYSPEGIDAFLAFRAPAPCSLCQDNPARRSHCSCSLPAPPAPPRPVPAVEPTPPPPPPAACKNTSATDVPVVGV